MDTFDLDDYTEDQLALTEHALDVEPYWNMEFDLLDFATN